MGEKGHEPLAILAKDTNRKVGPCMLLLLVTSRISSLMVFQRVYYLLSQLITSLDSSVKFFLLFWPEILFSAAYNDVTYKKSSSLIWQCLNYFRYFSSFPRLKHHHSSPGMVPSLSLPLAIDKPQFVSVVISVWYAVNGLLMSCCHSIIPKMSLLSSSFGFQNLYIHLDFRCSTSI